MSIPPIGAAVPRQGNLITRGLGRLFLRLLKWDVRGEIPDFPRFLIIVVPHTSNWDVVIGIAVKLAMALDVYWLGKHTLFTTPLRPLLLWLNGIPVNRTAPQGMIESMVARFRESGQFVLAMSPEGTRRKVERWKSGFYFIAMRAGVPIVPVGLDYARKEIVFFAPFWATGRLEEDMERLTEQFKDVVPKHAGVSHQKRAR